MTYFYKTGILKTVFYTTAERQLIDQIERKRVAKVFIKQHIIQFHSVGLISVLVPWKWQS